MNGQRPERDYARTMRVDHDSAAGSRCVWRCGPALAQACRRAAPRGVVQSVRRPAGGGAGRSGADRRAVALCHRSGLSVVADKARAFRKARLAGRNRPSCWSPIWSDRAERSLGDAADADLAGPAGGRDRLRQRSRFGAPADPRDRGAARPSGARRKAGRRSGARARAARSGRAQGRSRPRWWSSAAAIRRGRRVSPRPCWRKPG